MFRRFPILLVVLIALAGFTGCASGYGLFNADRPGALPWAGGEMQLIFSNPEYAAAGFDPLDRLTLEETRMWRMFGTNSGHPVVTGGIGLMQTWHF